MNFNVYLPDDLGEQAKAEELRLSRLLREAVVNELHRRETLRETLEEPQVYEVEICDTGLEDGETIEERGSFLGRITGKLVYETTSTPTWLVFVTTDHRVILYNQDDLQFYELGADATEGEVIQFMLKHIEPGFEFPAACRAVGVRPVIDL